MTRGINRGRPLRAADKLVPQVGVVPSELILDFAQRWYLFGGGDAEEVMVTFGWTVERYFTELRSILQSGRTPGLAAEVVSAMLSVCETRLRYVRRLR